MALRRADPEAVAAAGARFERARRLADLGAHRLGLGVQRIHRGLVGRREVHAEQSRPAAAPAA